jgi:hypothetical protein
MHVMHVPAWAVRENYALDALVGSIVHGLSKVGFSEIGASRLHLDEVPELTLELDRQITKRAPDRELRCDLAVLVISKHVSQEISHDHRGTRLIHISSLGRREESLVPPKVRLGT